MAESPDRPIRKFNPGTFQTDDDLHHQFVVRHATLDDVLEVLEANINAPSCRHILIKGDRGQGKTMLLARVAVDLRTDSRFNRHLLPIRFMEENHEIVTFGDFWLEALFYLARAVPHGASELLEERSRLAEDWRAQGFADRARAAVVSAAERLDRRLVLMVENFDELCANLDKASSNLDKASASRLYEAMHCDPHLMLLATTSSSLDVKHPLSGVFSAVFELKPLSDRDCRALWTRVTGVEATGEAFGPIPILTARNPRLLTMIAGLSPGRSLPQLLEEFVGLLDEHTEYFRGRIADLPAVERRVYIAVADDHGRYSSPGDIAARARMDIRPTSAMLGRLAARGMINAKGSVKKRRYGTAQSLLGLYYTFRRTRDVRDIVRPFIDLMLVLYPGQSREQIVDTIVAELPSLALTDEQVRLVRRAVHRHGGSGDDQVRALLESGGAPATEPHVDTGEELAEAREARALLGTLDECRRLADRIGVCDRIVEQFGGSRDRDVRLVACEALNEKARYIGDDEAAARILRLVRDRFVVDQADRRVVDDLFGEGRVHRLVADADGRVVELRITANAFPESMLELTRLRNLVVAVRDRPGGIPDGIGRLTALRRLTVWGAQLRGLPDSIGKIKELRSLRVNSYDSGAIPDAIGHLGALEDLVIHGSSGEIPHGIGNLENLEQLYLSGRAWEIPASVGRLQNLRGLMLLGRFRRIPSAIGALVNLHSLGIRGRFARIPAAIGRLKGLEELTLRGAFAVIPEAVGTLTELRTLVLKGRFVEVPAGVVGGLGELRELDLDGDDQLMEPLPKGLTRLKKLERLTTNAPDPMDAEFLAWAARVRYRTLAGRLENWREIYKKVFVADVGNRGGIMALTIDEAISLVSMGAAESDILETLCSDRRKSEVLWPLVVALRMRRGESVGAPPEVREVAEDIVKRIEERRLEGRARSH